MTTARLWIGVAVAALVVSGCASWTPEDEPTARPEPYPWSPTVAAVDSAATSVEGMYLVSARVHAVRAVPQPSLDVRTDPDAVLAAYDELLLDPERVAQMTTGRAWANVGDSATLRFRGCISGWAGSLEVHVDPRPGRTVLGFECQRVRLRGSAAEVEVEARANLMGLHPRTKRPA